MSLTRRKYVDILGNMKRQLAKIKGYKGIDDYVLHLIEHKLESIRDGGQGIDDLGEYVIEYLAKTIGPDDEEEKEVKDEEEV
ncbi:MAG: hypothetical protein ACXWEW_04325 [Nitrososphaeraceae archaeon]